MSDDADLSIAELSHDRQSGLDKGLLRGEGDAFPLRVNDEDLQVYEQGCLSNVLIHLLGT